MEFTTKFLIVSALAAVTCGRSLWQERNISNSSEDVACDCDWRYYKHYAYKGCVVEQYNSCGCPKKFSCPFNQTLQSPSKVCTFRNKEYKVGSKIIISDACKVCRCYDGVPPFISCINKECPPIQHVPGKECHLVYKENKCCPVGQECFESELETTNNESLVCEYNGKLYPYGSKIYPVDDPCQTCSCNERWNGVDNSSCYQHDCVFEMNKYKLDAGCIPVYHESRCCPIEFYCPSSQNLSYSMFPSNETSEKNETSQDYCLFDAQFYKIGEELSMDNPCVTCSCTVPPDFTCVHQTCPPSPNEENCFPFYNVEQCCPSYECLLGDAEPTTGGCPTPLCADSSCRIETPPGHECPTCVCKEKVSELEHNNLQRQIQVNQNIEHEMVEGFGEIDDDYSEDELQRMPLRMQDSGTQQSIMEKMIVSETAGADGGLRELQENSTGNNTNTEVTTLAREDSETEQSPSESVLNDTISESNSNETERVVQKRSDISDAANVGVPVHQRELTDQHMQEINRDLEREGGSVESNGEDFVDELESFKNRILNNNGTIINEIIGIDHVVKVPIDCPTPLCEGPWCKIGIPAGHRCPTCICKRHVGNEP